MTAPAVTPSTPVVEAPVQPTQAVPSVTPVIESVAKVEPVGLNAMIDKIARESKVGVDEVVAQQPEPTPVATDPNAPPPPVAIGAEGEIKVDGDDITLRAERNADGTFKTQIDPSQKFDIEIRDPETGEIRKYTKSMPEVLRMARDGVWGQKVKDEVKYYRDNVADWQKSHEQVSQKVTTLEQTATSLQEQLEAQMALNRELLTAEDEVVIRRREEFAHEMSPEQRLAKLEAQIRQERENAQMTERQQELARHADSFIQTRLAPVLMQAETALGGNDFARQLVAGQIALMTTPLLRNGQLPPEAWSKVEAYVRGPFQSWVQQTAAFQRTQETQGEALRKAQAQAQAAVNSTGQLLRPVGNVNGAMAPAPQGPPKDMKDAMSRIINRPLASAG